MGLNDSLFHSVDVYGNEMLLSTNMWETNYIIRYIYIKYMKAYLFICLHTVCIDLTPDSLQQATFP